MGRSLNYVEKIKESVEELEVLEKGQKLVLFRDRVRYLRLLKSGVAKTQKSASDILEISERQGQRNWKLYRDEGLEGLLRPIQRPGAPPKLTAEELSELSERLKADDIQFLHEAVNYVKEKYQKTYTLAGMHFVFKRLKVKKKTGRPVNIRQDASGMTAFKKTINH